MFQNRDSGGFSDRVGRDQWDVTAPQVLGIFPAVSRQVLRGDVKQAQVTATRYVHIPSLVQGKLGFDDQVKQAHDTKSFDSDKVPAETLAVARSVVSFGDTDRSTPSFDLAPYTQQNALRSATDQLTWHPGKNKRDGFFAMDTPATKAVVGFAKNRTCNLGDISITLHCPYAALYITAQEPDRDLRSSRKILIVAMARARNTGMKFNDTEDEVLDRGQGPIRLEPVEATLQFKTSKHATLTLLDHDGLRTPTTRAISNGKLKIDGTRDRTPYYLLEY